MSEKKVDQEVFSVFEPQPKGCLFAFVVNTHGKYPSLGASKEALVAMWLGLDDVKNPVDVIRDRLMAALKRNWDVWQYRLTCDGNCYSHPDGMVINCYLQSGTSKLYEE